MGLIKYSGLVTGIWGKVNGSVFTKNRTGTIIKNKQTPINQRSTLQTPNRNTINQISKRWAILTDGQRIEWNSLALTITLKNYWGDSYHPSGFNTFCRLNQNLFLCECPQIDDAPLSKDVIALSPVDVGIIEESFPTINFNFSHRISNINTIHLIYSSAGNSQGIFYNKKNMKIIAMIPPLTDSTFNAYSGFILKYPIFKTGQKIFFKLRAVNKLTGFDSLVGTWSRIVGAVIPLSGIGYWTIGGTFIIS